MYCAADDVALLLQIPNFSPTTDPTQAQVETVIENMAARIDLALSGAGVVIPVVDPAKLKWLASVNALGAAGFIGMSTARGNESVDGNQAAFYWRNFLSEIEAVKTNFTGTIKAGVSVAGGARPWENQVDW